MEFWTNKHHSFYSGDVQDWWTDACPTCGSYSVDGILGRMTRHPKTGAEFSDLLIGLCRKCDHAAIVQVVEDSGRVSPSPRPFEALNDLPNEVEVAWEEARAALGAGAPMAAAHVLRKILFHVAVEQGLPAKKDSGRAPGFAECVEYLFDRGLVPVGWRERLDLVREIGNDAAHELPAADSELVRAQGTFVMAMLRFIYTEAAAAEKAKSLFESVKTDRKQNGSLSSGAREEISG